MKLFRTNRAGDMVEDKYGTYVDRWSLASRLRAFFDHYNTSERVFLVPKHIGGGAYIRSTNPRGDALAELRDLLKELEVIRPPSACSLCGAPPNRECSCNPGGF